MHKTVSRFCHSEPKALPLGGGRYSNLFTALFIFSAAAIAYGTYGIYDAMTLWPPALRLDLRTALRKKYNNDLDESEAYFRRAWSTAKELPLSELAPQPYLKITGIAIALGSMLESSGRWDQAYGVYSDTLSHLREAENKVPLSIEEQLRGVALSCKLAEMANATGRGDAEEEKWLVGAVEVILRHLAVSNSTIIDGKPPSDKKSLDLPQWTSAVDLAAPFEALGTLYIRSGRDDYALPLFLQAVSFLVPTPPRTSSVADRCRGAQTMSSICELLMRVNPSTDGIAQAESWSRRALDITMDARNKLRRERTKWTQEMDPICEVALAVSLFNIGVLREMANDKKEANRFLRMSLNHSQSIGLKEGIYVTSGCTSVTCPSGLLNFLELLPLPLILYQNGTTA
ncbi:hypothetical protein APHAL10511_006809 [Amanita phalloides]|nr:hypothetical protein APHAL10511_006809 [Amanita phalloides]